MATWYSKGGADAAIAAAVAPLAAAYAAAVIEGFDGSMQAWLMSLRNPAITSGSGAPTGSTPGQLYYQTGE